VALCGASIAAASVLKILSTHYKKGAVLKYLFAALSAFMFVGVAQAQGGAPGLATCQVDVALWYSPEAAIQYYNDDSSSKSEVARVPLREVESRLHELEQCWEASGHQEIYYKADKFYNQVRLDRYFSFVHRHPAMLEQLKKEDAEGLR
jgi:hypothetical protein